MSRFFIKNIPVAIHRFSLNLSEWYIDTYTDVNMNSMFYRCQDLGSLNVSGWHIANDINVSMSGMFSNCSSLTSLDLSGWGMVSVTHVQQLQ